MPTLIEKKLGQGLIGTNITALYTVPTATSAIIREVLIANASAGEVSIELWAGVGSEITQRVIPNILLPACGVLTWDGTVVLNAADKVQAKAGTASMLHCLVTGAEVS